MIIETKRLSRVNGEFCNSTSNCITISLDPNKKARSKHSLRTRILLIILLMTQSGWQSGEERELEQVLESPSIIIWSHLSSLAIYAAHKMADAWAWSAGQSWWLLAQTFIWGEAHICCAPEILNNYPFTFRQKTKKRSLIKLHDQFYSPKYKRSSQIWTQS